MILEPIQTANAPQAIGPYSQAIKHGNTVYLSGQIPLVPATMLMEDGDMEAQIRQVFDNIQAVAQAAGGRLADLVKITVFLTDLSQVPLLNRIMAEYFAVPYPTRSVIGVVALPKGAAIEIDGIIELPTTQRAI